MSSEIPLILSPGEQVLLPTNERGESLFSLRTQQGVGRLATITEIKKSDMTLGFTGASCSEWLITPQTGQITIEALTPLEILVAPADSIHLQNELIRHWLWDFHHVRHPVGAMARLKALLQLMITRFGRRTLEGYTLPFYLSHSRVAELIGVTRSTATRLLNIQRQQGQLCVDGLSGTYVIAPSMMEFTPNWIVDRTDDA